MVVFVAMRGIWYPKRPWYLIVFFVVAVLHETFGGGGFAPSSAARAESAQSYEKATVTILSGTHRHPFIVEIAKTPKQRQQGLMGREQVPLNTGMLFVFEHTEVIHMWMANTPTSLDMLFADEGGRILRIESRTEPFSKRIISSGPPAKLVLEVRGGTAERLGIVAGDRIQMLP